MKPVVVKCDPEEEFYTSERCYIIEILNSPEVEGLSIARARVLQGVTTALHCLEGVDERYLIMDGTGMMEVGDAPPTKVGKGDVVVIPAGTSQRITNIGDRDLVFYCICTPRFTPKCYHGIEPE